jgi:hypothetical protein
MPPVGNLGRMETAVCSRDVEIRSALVDFILEEYKDSSDLTCLHELSINGGEIRADVAALNGHTHGYEIKSALDSLVRLPAQISAYCNVFEKASLVVDRAHLRKARPLLPPWWGIIEASKTQDKLSLRRTRIARLNPDLCARSIANLLWRDELLKALATFGLDGGLHSKSSAVLVDALIEALSAAEISQVARAMIRARGDWRAAARLRRYGGSSRPRASQLGFRRIFSLNMTE